MANAAPRLLLFTDTLGDVNGVSRFIRNVADQALETGRVLHVLTSTRIEIPDRANLHNVAPRLAMSMPKYPQLELVLPAAGRLLALARAFRPDVVHVSTPGPVGLCGFIGEAFVVLSMWNFSPLLAIIAASGVILTAGYILWTIQRVYLGPEYKGPHPEDLTPMNGREATIAAIVCVFAVVLGVLPYTMLGLMEESVTKLTQDMAAGYAVLHDGAETISQVDK